MGNGAHFSQHPTYYKKSLWSANNASAVLLTGIKIALNINII